MKIRLSNNSVEIKSIITLSFILCLSLFFCVFYSVSLLSLMNVNLSTIISVFIVCFLEVLLMCYLLDEIFWQIRGVEIIEYDLNFIYIIKKGRLFNRYQKISWNNISKISHRKINPIWEFITYFTITGVSLYKLTLFLKNNKKIHCGYNLTEVQCLQIINMITKIIEEKTK